MDETTTEQSAPQINQRALHEGDELSGVFACTGKQILRSAATGKPYLVVDLRDHRGVVPARAFREPERLAARFEPGELVEVSGAVRDFRDELQLHLADIRAVPGDPTALLPHSYRDVSELDGFLEQLGREVSDRGLSRLLNALLADRELRTDWRRAPCDPGAHHGYCGGLLEHTVEVATHAESLTQVYPRLDRDLLISAALLHELGRTRQFAYGIDFSLTPEGRLLGHAQLGARLITERSRGLLGPERLDALLHCVLIAGSDEPGSTSLNGARVPGSPDPLPEAIALRGLCALDGSVKGALESLPGGPDLIKTRFDDPAPEGPK
jgi:3'-5' exoribonuclease